MNVVLKFYFKTINMILKIYFKTIFDKIYLKIVFTMTILYMIVYLDEKNTGLMNIFKTNVLMYFFFQKKNYFALNSKIKIQTN